MAGEDRSGGLDRALALIFDVVDVLGAGHESVRQAWPDAVDTAHELGRFDDVGALVELLEVRPPGQVPPFMRAQLILARGRLAASRAEDDETIERDLRAAVDAFEELGYPFWLARAQAELAAWLARRGREADATALLDEAIGGLERLRATPALSRARELETTMAGVSEAI
jgi:hypothetical protein